MKSYTNRAGEVVEVSQEHLDTAVEIKEQLQKASPSRKCSWNTHKKLMEKEGFIDSDTNESYRCMIKDYQKKQGKLPEAAKYADMVKSSKLESIKELVGEIAYEKRENQHVLRQLNKVKREVIDETLVAEQIREAFDNYDFSSLKVNYQPIEKKNGKKMIVCLSDLHIGALVDNHLNTYNFEVAQRRMNEYVSKVITECIKEEISKVYVVGLGDFVEHPYMHNLAYSSEFTYAEQVVRATDLITKFLITLSEHVEITYAGIAGNHDRLHDNKDKNLDGDHAVKSINYGIEKFIENAKLERIAYVQAKDYDHSISVNGINIKFVHGDKDSMKDENILAKHSSLDGVTYTMIVMGHFHHNRVIELGLNKYMIVFGSLKGADNYGINTRRVSSASQGIIIVEENGEFDTKSFKLS